MPLRDRIPGRRVSIGGDVPIAEVLLIMRQARSDGGHLEEAVRIMADYRIGVTGAVTSGRPVACHAGSLHAFLEQPRAREAGTPFNIDVPERKGEVAGP